MIRLGRRASLLIALYLLTSAATAYAECAWVLWEAAVDGLTANSGDWGPQTAAPTYAECKAAARERALKEKSRTWSNLESVDMMELTGGGGFKVVQRFRHEGRDRPSYTSWHFNCLPDTIDPRGPKGK
jgi:hypothetical protein